MTNHAKNSSHLQAVDLQKTMAVEIPLPLLGASANIEKSFFAGSVIQIEAPDEAERQRAKSLSVVVALRSSDLASEAKKARKSNCRALRLRQTVIRSIGIH